MQSEFLTLRYLYSMFKKVNILMKTNIFSSKHVRLLSEISNHSVLYSEKEPITVKNQYDILEDIAVPLYRLPYENQLKLKQDRIKSIVANILKSIKKQQKYVRNNFKLFPIIASPVTEYYRNKDEFSVRLGVDGYDKTFGCFSGKPDKELVYSIRPIYLPVVKKEHLKILEVFEDFVYKSSLPPCYSLNDGGYWRRILIKSNLKNEIMVVVTANPIERRKEDTDEEKKQLVDHFLNNGCKIHSFYHQLCTHVTCVKNNSTLSLIYGEPYIYEEIFEYKFRISPDSFFQINTEAAKLIFKVICELIDYEKPSVLLDLCCGVGTYSILYNKFYKSCIGIETNCSSIEDAIANAELNGITNCEFILGNVETRLNSVFQKLDYVSDINVIINPGRAGVHRKVIQLLRENSVISKILYVTCKPDNRNVTTNIIDLMKQERRSKTSPFKLKYIKSVDLFPHTFHYETIFYFER